MQNVTTMQHRLFKVLGCIEASFAKKKLLASFI